jgi:flagellar basal-body rod protein FlgF
MDSLMTSAASGMKARMETLDMLANNVANTATVAFKADREFYGVYVSEQSAAEAGSAGELRAPVIEKHWTDYSQGVLLQTGNPLDLAISGKGFFVVDSPSGPLYTRKGNFQMGKAGQIETTDGYSLRILDQNGKPVRLDPTKSVDVGKDGVVKQDGQELGQIQTVDFDNANQVSKRGSTYFMWNESKPPKSTQNSEMHQGMVETSNVPVAEAAVKLVSVMRQFETLQRAISLGSDMNKRSIEEVAKVS